MLVRRFSGFIRLLVMLRCFPHVLLGSVVSVKMKVPINNALLVQLIRSIGMRKVTGVNNVDQFSNQTQSSNRSSKHNVCLSPAMDSTTVGAGKFLLLHFCRRPKFLFNRATGISEFRGRGTTHEQAFQIGASLRFRSSSRWVEIKSPGHVRVDKQCALWRCRRATSASSRDRPQSGE
jgi:hypothetical protein